MHQCWESFNDEDKRVASTALDKLQFPPLQLLLKVLFYAICVVETIKKCFVVQFQLGSDEHALN